MAIPVFWEHVFHWCICQPHPSLSSPEIPRWRIDTGSSYYFATENVIKVISAVAAMFHRARRQYAKMVEQHQVQIGSRNITQNRKFARDAVFWSRTQSIRAQPSLECPKHLHLALEIASISVSVSELLLLPVYTWCVDTHGSGLRVPENIAAEITLISFSITKL